MDNTNETKFINKDLRIVFWNACSIPRRREELEIIMKNIDILICVESCLNHKINDFDVQFNGFIMCRKEFHQEEEVLFI